MKKEEIERLLNQYYDGNTNEQEEEALLQALRNAGNDLPPNLQAEKRLYLALHSGPTQAEAEARTPHSLEKQLSEWIDRKAAAAAAEADKRLNHHRLWLRVASLAAAVMLVVGIGLGLSDMKRHNPSAIWQDTYTDPHDADRALHDILSELSKSWHEGIRQLEDNQNDMMATAHRAQDKEIHP